MHTEDWIYNTLDIENLNPESNSRLKHWFSHARKNVSKLDGDLFEFGVYKGGGTIAMALQLKMLDSNKKIYAFDSFSGFPSYHPNDDYINFEKHACARKLLSGGWECQQPLQTFPLVVIFPTYQENG